MGFSVRWEETSAVRGAMVTVAKDAIDIEKVRRDLIIPNPVYFQAKARGHTPNVSPEVILYKELEDGFIQVPRHYRGLPEAVLNQVKDRRRVREGGYCEPVEHSITLRDEIQAAASAALTKDSEDKIISLSCGKGKTVTSLHAASVGKRFPLLVVVHTNALKGQWIENYGESGDLIGGIRKFYGLKREEIGVIQGPEASWEGKRVAVAMLHSLCLKDYPPEFYNYWRLVIFDEAHRLGAEMFGQAAPLFPCERWGLSATVDREDGMERVFQFHLGRVVYKNVSQPLKPKVYFVNTGINFGLGRYVMRSGRVNSGQLMTALSEHPERQELLLSQVTRAAKAGRTILILGERLTSLHEGYEAMKAAGYDASIHVGSMGEEERRDALRHQVVFATQHLAKEGLDRPAFDTLFIVIPFGGDGRLAQSFGRILREKEGKKDPKVIVLVDGISYIQALANRMRKSCRRLGYEVVEVERRVG